MNIKIITSPNIKRKRRYYWFKQKQDFS